MEGIYKHNEDCFDVYINDKDIVDKDEFLGKVLKYLIDNGYSISLKGFDKYNRPLVEINGVLHTADKNLACCLVERFINVKHKTHLIEDLERYNKIHSFIY